MKVLVLNKDLTERAMIQQVLQHSSHEIMSAEDSETAGTGSEFQGVRIIRALVQTDAGGLFQIGVPISRPGRQSSAGKGDLHARGEAAGNNVKVDRPAVT